MDTFVPAVTPRGARTLAARYYLDDDVFSRERERIFARSWTCVGRDEDLPNSGDYLLADVGGESVIVVRDAHGELRAHYNVCRHRGTQLCTEARGRFAGAIQCPYHAWTYELSGELRAARSMESIADFERADYPLISAHVAADAGFIFVALEPPIESRPLAPLDARIAPWRLDSLRVRRSAPYALACNWKLVFQNYSECYHCAPIHPQLTRLSPPDSGRNDLLEGRITGGYMTLRDGAGSMTAGGRRAAQPVGDVAGDDLERVYYYTIFPTMLLSLHPDYVLAHRVRALAPDRTEIVCEWLFAPDAPGVGMDDAFAFWDLTNRQDWRVSELSQRGIASRAYRPGPYSGAEGLLAAFDRHYRAQLGEAVE